MRCLIIFFVFSTFIVHSQKIYLSGPGLKGTTISGPHTNEIPLEGFEMQWDEGSNHTMSRAHIKFQKKLDQSTLELVHRSLQNNGVDSLFVFRFYDQNDVNYFTIKVDGYLRNDLDAKTIFSPPCSTGNCANQLEEYELYSSLCWNTTSCGAVVFTYEPSGETKTYD